MYLNYTIIPLMLFTILICSVNCSMAEKKNSLGM